MGRTSEVLVTADGVQLSVDWYRGDGRSSAVIVCPGFFQSKGTPIFQRLCERLAETRDVIAVDFRGHGCSGGLYTFSAREGTDLEAVLRWAERLYPDLGVMGFSMGGAISIIGLARYRSVVRTLIAVSAPAAFEDVEFRFWTPEALRSGLESFERGVGCRPGNPWLGKPRAVDHVGGLQGLPILFVHGTRDEIVKPRHSERLFAAAAEPKRLEIIPGGSHAQMLFRDDPARFSALVDSWLAATLPPLR